MKGFIRKLITVSFSTADGLAEFASTSSSLFWSLKNTKIPQTANYGLAMTLGLITGVINWINDYYFQGPVIKQYLSRKKYTSIPEAFEHKVINNPIPLTRKEKIIFLIKKYGFIGFSNWVEFLDKILLWVAIKAYSYDLSHNKNDPFVDLTTMEILGVSIYWLLIRFMFTMTNQVWQVLEEIEAQYRRVGQTLPDEAFSKKIHSLVRPLASSYIYRRYIHCIGSLTDTLEHVIPLILIIPASVIEKLLEQPLSYIVGTGIISVPILLFITIIILVQTYLFEGNYSDRNLRFIANLENKAIERWIPAKLSKGFHWALYLGGPLHAIDTTLALVLLLRYFEAHPAITISVGMWAAVSTWLGTHFSEVNASQSELEKISKPSIWRTLSNYNYKTFFSKSSQPLLPKQKDKDNENELGDFVLIP